MLINNFTIGADPEFAVIDSLSGKLHRLDEVFGPHIHSDHGGDCLEFTPWPAKSAFILTKNINKILTGDDFIKHLDRRYKLVSRAVVEANRRLVTLGGHIHFSDKTAINDPKCRALDGVTKFLEAMDILPKDDSIRRRHSGMGNGYGQWSDFRYSNGDRTVEYRTMCSWLHHPFATFLCLTLGKLAVAEPKPILNNLLVEKAGYPTLEKTLRLFNDADSQRAIEKLIEKKIDLTANVDVDIRDSWKQINKLYRRVAV